MKYIVCNLGLFSLHQKVYYVDENGMILIGETGLSHLPNLIAQSCDQYNVNKVRLIGGGETFAMNLSNEIRKVGMTDYNKSLEIEVE